MNLISRSSISIHSLWTKEIINYFLLLLFFLNSRKDLWRLERPSRVKSILIRRLIVEKVKSQVLRDRWEGSGASERASELREVAQRKRGLSVPLLKDGIGVRWPNLGT